MLKTSIDIGKNREIFEKFIRKQNATELLKQADSIGWVGLDFEKAIDAVATSDYAARIYRIYPINGGEINFSNKMELGLALLRLKHA